MAKKLTLHDLAKAAKVSPATVSRVVAGNPSVDPTIRNHVRRAAEKIGLDLEERRRGKSRLIAFLLANRDALHAFHARVLVGAETYCAQHHWEVLFLSFRYAPETPPEALHLPQLLGPQTSARAVILGGINSPNLFRALQARGLPFAVLGNNVGGEWAPGDYDVAYSNDLAGAFDATRHLLSQGHRAIGFVGNLQLPWFQRRAAGYHRAMTEAGLESRCEDLRSDGAQLGYLATKSLLARDRSLTAVLAGSDEVAVGVYQALRELKRAVPHDVSVIGGNDTQATCLAPELTSVREFPEEIGRHLAEFVLQRAKNPALPHRSLTIPTQLVLRDSVRLAAGARSRPKAARSARR